MKFETFSIVVGSRACNARCPFCISKMTPNQEPLAPKPVNWRNFRIASRMAVRSGVSTAMLTGQGEPTLCPQLITDYLGNLVGDFPIIELQTNGIDIASGKISWDKLRGWYYDGLTTVAVSTAHFLQEKNAEIYGGKHYYMEKLVKLLHSVGLSVRLSAILLDGYLGDTNSVTEMIRAAKQWGVEQLTLTPVNAPAKSADATTKKWVKEHRVNSLWLDDIQQTLNCSPLLWTLPHGAPVYDVGGQNVCFNSCLSRRRRSRTFRNLIFYPDGHLRTDWDHEGSILL